MREQRYEGDIVNEWATSRAAAAHRSTNPNQRNSAGTVLYVIVGIITVALLFGVGKFIIKAVHTFMPWLW